VNTMLPVYRGEIQCRMLGMSIYAYSDDGKRLPLEASGELVCDVAFPCQPIGFWPLPGCGPEDEVNAAQVRYADAYYATIKGVWCELASFHLQPQLIEINRSWGSCSYYIIEKREWRWSCHAWEERWSLVRISALPYVHITAVSPDIFPYRNPGGIRFGSAEIYEVLDQCFSASAPNPHNKLEDYVVVGQKISNGADERVLLFVKLVDGEKLDSRLEKQIRSEIASRRSRRHIPDKVSTVSFVDGATIYFRKLQPDYYSPRYSLHLKREES
jgi:acetoacetyl-CoA synthetase